MNQLRLFEDGTEIKWPNIESMRTIERTHSVVYGAREHYCRLCGVGGRGLIEKPCRLAYVGVDLWD